VTDKELIAKLGAREVVALTLYGEARGEGRKGREAIASVIGNRVKAKRYGKDLREVCLRKWQFSCWLPQGGAANYESVLDAARVLVNGEDMGPVLKECLAIAGDLCEARLADPVKEATHYMTRSLWRSAKAPEWVKGLEPCATLGRHVFFKDVDSPKSGRDR
jgi:hypothetical protein